MAVEAEVGELDILGGHMPAQDDVAVFVVRVRLNGEQPTIEVMVGRGEQRESGTVELYDPHRAAATGPSKPTAWGAFDEDRPVTGSQGDIAEDERSID